MSSYRDIEKPGTEVQIYLPDPGRADEAKALLSAALETAGCFVPVSECEIADEDWKFAYRRHFKTQFVGERLAIVPSWEAAGFSAPGRERIVLDPGMAFGTGNHETTRACLEFIDGMAREASMPASFLDMGCGSGILSIAAAKLGFGPVAGFDIDSDAVAAARENAALNAVQVEYTRFALGRGDKKSQTDGRADLAPQAADFAAANILGPLLVKFSREIDALVRKKLVISGILAEIYDETLAAFTALGWREAGRKTQGEWTSGLLEK